MVSVCLPSDALLQHLPSYLGFSYLGRGVSLHGCSSKAQPLLLTLGEGYLLTAALPDLQHEIAPLVPPMPAQSPLLGLLLRATPQGHPSWPRVWVAPPSCRPWPQAPSGSSRSPPLASGTRWLLLATTDLGRRMSPPGRCPDLGKPGMLQSMGSQRVGHE